MSYFGATGTKVIKFNKAFQHVFLKIKNENNCNPGPLKKFPGHLILKGSGPGWPPGSKTYVTL